MVRRKKSLLFSLSLASAGLVAGAMFAAAPKTQASNDELSAATTDAKIQAISRSTNAPAETVIDSLKTHKLILGITDKKELDENEDVVDYKKVAEGVYVVTFKDYDATSENYIYYRDNEKADGVSLNMPMEIKENLTAPISINGTDSIPEIDRCKNVTPENVTFSGFTNWPDQCLAWGVDSMKLLDYAKTITSANKVRVAVVDSGISANHLVFKYSSPKDRLDMTLAHDYIDNDSDPDDSQNKKYVDEDGKETDITITHGTTVASTIAESTPFNVKIVPVRIGDGENFVMSDVLEAVSALKGKVDIINLSLGATIKIRTTDNGYDKIDMVMKEAKDAGTIVIAASGNNGQNYVSWPAMSAHTIAVGAINKDKAMSSFSQYGNEIDFTAPGENLLLPEGGDKTTSFTYTSGTSFATPFISAAVANILSEHPDYNYDKVYDTLKMNAEDLGTPGKDEKFGWGSVSFHINKFADLTIPNINADNNNWTNSGVNVGASVTSSAYNITHYALQNGDTTKVQPTTWAAIEAPGKTVTINKLINSNGTYTLWVKNSNNEIKAKTLTINNIDKTTPTISTGFKVSSITDTGATLSIGVKDTNSGLAKIIWHYKLEDDKDYIDETETYATTGTGTTAATIKTFTLSGLESNKKYTAYASVYDMAGNSKNSAVATFTVAADAPEVKTDGDDDKPTTTANNGQNKPKLVNTKNSNIKNPKTADINLTKIAGVGILLSTTAFFIFRAKRR